MGVFASPLKPYLKRQLEIRNKGPLAAGGQAPIAGGKGRPVVSRNASQENMQYPIHGLPNNPQEDLDEAIKEIRDEIDARKRSGSLKMGANRSHTAPVEAVGPKGKAA
jgi:hypothetical protein